VAFQPIAITRTRDMLQEFGGAFSDADTVLVTDVYAAGEPPIDGMTGERVATEILGHGKSASYVQSFEEATARLVQVAHSGDMILTLVREASRSLGRRYCRDSLPAQRDVAAAKRPSRQRRSRTPAAKAELPCPHFLLERES